MGGNYFGDLTGRLSGRLNILGAFAHMSIIGVIRRQKMRLKSRGAISQGRAF